MKLSTRIGILNFTKTTLGKALLRQWCLRPSLSREVISARHDAVACFVRGENMILAETIHGQLKGLKDVPRSLAIVRAGKAGTREWQAMVKVCRFTLCSLDVLSISSHPLIVRISFQHGT